MPQADFMTVAEVAAELRVHSVTVQKLCRDGALEFVRVEHLPSGYKDVGSGCARRGEEMVATDYLPAVVDMLVKGFHPRRIILFGSFARGDAGPDSDLDLLVVMDHVENKRKATVAMLNTLADLPVPKDVIVTTPDEIARRGHVIGTVLEPALREGTVLYEHP